MGNFQTKAPAAPAAAATSAGETAAHTLGDCMAMNARRYLADLNGTPCREGLYARMMREIEPPLLREVLAWSGGNQSRAAAILGIHRATLHKKLHELGID
jgi:Fis family transcriptional regulator